MAGERLPWAGGAGSSGQGLCGEGKRRGKGQSEEVKG